jgi:hypothetical protein
VAAGEHPLNRLNRNQPANQTVTPNRQRFACRTISVTLLSARRGLFPGSPSSVQDQLRYLLRVADEREVARVEVDRRGVHAAGHELL